MKDKIYTIAGILAIAVILGSVAWFITYKFRDCLKVGHTTLYCVLDLG